MKSKILLALTLLLGVSTTTWAVGNLGKANQKKHAYTNEDVWAAYEGFNNTLLDSNKYIYKTNSSYPSAVDRGNGAAAIWCQPIYWDMAMNAYKLAKAQKDRKKTSYYKTLCEKIFAGNKAQYCQFDLMITMKIPAGSSTMTSCGGLSAWHVATNFLEWMNI